jgi:hypothetical protein
VKVRTPEINNPQVSGRTETDFLSLDKHHKIGYNSDVKLGKRSGPCREKYVAKLFFPIPNSLFPLVCHAVLRTPCGPPAGGLLPAPTHSRESAKRDEKPANLPPIPKTRSHFKPGRAKEDYLRMNERCGNVVENKGPMLKSCR